MIPRTLEQAFGRGSKLHIEREPMKLETAMWWAYGFTAASLLFLFIFEVVR